MFISLIRKQMEMRADIFLLTLGLIFLSTYIVEGRNTGLRMKRQSEPVQQPKRIVCYYAFWAARRPGEFKFVPSDIDPTLCTHIMYGYARLEPNEGVVPYDFEVDIQNRGWASMVELKKISPQAKIMLSMGGLFEGSSRFTKMASDVKQRELFVKSASKTLRDNGFDGLDMSWLYPGFSQGSSTVDKENYVTLMKELKEEFKEEFVLSITVPALKQYIDSGFNVPELLKYAEYMNVLAYSYHDSTDATVNHHGPLYSLPNDPGNKDANVDTTILEYIRRGARPDQLNLVIPLYGVAFVLEDPEKNEIGDNTEDEGIGLEEPGALIYFELCQRIRKESWTVKKVNSTAMGPYAYKDRLWVAYDDEEMVKNKAKYALEKGLGGLGFWTVDQDDFRGRCSVDNYPLLRAGRQVFLASNNLDDVLQDQPANVVRTTTAQPETSPSASSGANVQDTMQADQSATTYRPRTTSSTTNAPSTSKPSIALVLNDNPSREDKKNSPPSNFWSSSDDVYLTPGRSEGQTIYRSNRDIVFSDFKIWIQNHFNAPPTNHF